MKMLRNQSAVLWSFNYKKYISHVPSETSGNSFYLRPLPKPKGNIWYKNKVVVEFSSSCDILRATCTCPAGLGLQRKGKCNHIRGVLFAVEDFIRRGLQNHPEPLTCTSLLSVMAVPYNQSVAEKPLDKASIRKIRFGQKNRRTCPKIIKFYPRIPQQCISDDVSLSVYLLAVFSLLWHQFEWCRCQFTFSP